MEDLIAACINSLHFRTGKPAHDVHEMDSVVHDRTAACQLRVHEPGAIFCGQLTLVGGVETVNVAKVTVVEPRFDLQQRRAEAHRESGHQENAGLFTGIYNGARIFEVVASGFSHKTWMPREAAISTNCR